MRMQVKHFIPLLSHVIYLACCPSASAEDYYFVTVYGGQRPFVNRPCYSHTWATFIKVTQSGPAPETRVARSFTISWLSENLRVNPYKIRAEAGVNLTLEETLKWCEQNRMEVAQYGPYQSTPDLWNMALARFQKLEQHEMNYRAADILNPWRTTCNCIYAVLDLDGRDPAFRPVTLGFGNVGSAFVVRRLNPYLVNTRVTYPWVSDLIGVKNYPTPIVSGLIAR